MADGPKPDYTYEAVVLRWVDGDTVDLRVDVGFYMWFEGRFRLYGIDTPERGQPGYREATEHNSAIAPTGTQVTIRTYKAADKYGRFLAEVFVLSGEGVTDINASLVHEGLARPYFGGTKEKV